MKKLFVILLLISGTAYGQVPSLSLYSVPGQTQIKNYVKYVTDSVGLVSAAQYKSLPTLDTSTQAKLRNGKIMILQDAAIPVLQSQAITLQTSLNSQVTALQGQDKAAAVQIATLQAQTTSQQLQLNNQQAVIDKQAAQIAELLAWKANMKTANQ